MLGVPFHTLLVYWEVVEVLKTMQASPPLRFNKSGY
jgi:hypothetical protein